MKYFIGALQKKQISVLKTLGRSMTARDFYLAGGTALAVHLGHRTSVDLDWFTPHPFDGGLTLAQYLRDSGIKVDIEQAAPGTLHGRIRGVRTSFLQYQYPQLQPLLDWSEMHCKLAGLEDLACMKLSAIAQRGARKDFCDVYALGEKCFSLQDMLEFYQRKFSISDVGSVLYGLVYFDDAESEPMPRMLWKVTWREIKRTVLGWVKAIS